MAKAKVEKSKKAIKAKAIKDTITTLRRSPRKGVPSVYNTDTINESVASKVVKRTSPVKRPANSAKKISLVKDSASPVKTVLPAKESESSVKKVSRKERSGSPTKKTSPAKRRASPPKNASPRKIVQQRASRSPAGKKFSTTPATPSTSTSPKPRGRPRKDNTNHGIVSNEPRKDSPRLPGRSRSAVTEVPALSADGSWTDSPRKKSPSRRSSRSSARSTSRDNLADDDLTSVRISSVGGVRKSIEADGHGTNVRGRSQGPSKKLNESSDRTPGESPARARGRSISVPLLRSPSKSPAKSVRRSTSAQSTARSSRPRSLVKAASRSPSVGLSQGSLRVEKTRSIRSPTKPRAQLPSRTRSTSPVKMRAVTSPARRLSAPVTSPASTRSRSPAKQQAPQARTSMSDSDFEKRFAQADDYGKELRRTESAAYKSMKEGIEYTRHNQHISKGDESRAKQRGFLRAELESGLHETASAKNQSVWRNSNDKDVLMPGANSKRTGGRKPSFYDQYKDQAKLHQPFIGRTKGEDEPAGPTNLPFIRASPSRSTTSDGHQVCPERSRSRKRSSNSRCSSSTVQSTNSIAEAKHSAPDEGPVQSVTNPKFIPDTKTKKKNPFFEMMPRPEVWHRRMPPFLPFGETPAMELEMSRQISEDHDM